jgi:hypothetical protein
VVHTQGWVIRAVKLPTNVVLLHDQTEEADGDRRRQREGWPAGKNPPAPRHLNEVVVEGEAERPQMESLAQPGR